MKTLNKLFAIIIGLICIVNATQSQTLSKEQMESDLRFLQEHVHKYFYPLSLLERRTGINVDDEYKKLHAEITQTTSIEEFTHIIRQGLNMLMDGHSQIIPKAALYGYIHPDYYLSSIGNASLSDTLNADYYYSIITDSIQPKVKTGLRARFMNGDYYNARPFISNNGIPILAGEKISAINGIPMNQFIEDNYLKMYYMYWDPISKKKFSTLFTLVFPLLNIEKYSLTIGDKDIELETGKTVEGLQREHPTSSFSRNVILIDSTILYIRMPQMYDSEWYINELLRIYTPNVEKIVIDVRDNSGGSDGVWAELLRKIIDKPLTYTYHVGINHNETIEKALLSTFSDFKMTRKGDKTEIFNETVEVPDSNSIHFKGKIYVLQNEWSYSAATALSSVAMQNENMVVVGAPSILIGGYTLPAIAFKLPNSGLAFTLAFSADISGGENNPYMDKVEVEILENDIQAYTDKILNYDCYSKDYLSTKDELIKYVKSH
jgi:hypothetical protein